MVIFSQLGRIPPGSPRYVIINHQQPQQRSTVHEPLILLPKKVCAIYRTELRVFFRTGFSCGMLPCTVQVQDIHIEHVTSASACPIGNSGQVTCRTNLFFIWFHASDQEGDY